MVSIVYLIFLLCAFLAIANNLIDINVMESVIDEMLDEEKRQNERIDALEKREQIRQSEERHDKAYIESKDLFEKW